MKTIQITYENVNYDVIFEYINAFPNGYFKVSWEDDNLKRLYKSPIYITYKAENKLQLPDFSTHLEGSFYMSIATGIFTDQFNLYK